MVAPSLLLALTLATAPAPQAEEPPPLALEEPAAPLPDEPYAGLLAAAGWCVLTTEDSEPPGNETPGEDTPEVASKNDRPGCDIGLGASLYREKRFAVVAVVGTETVGLGVAWVLAGKGARAVAVAAGIVAKYDEHGIYLDEIYPALGVTVAFLPGK